MKEDFVELPDPATDIDAYKAANTAYLETNAAKDGWVTTESGLQYYIVQDGEGTSPTAEDYVEVHYQGLLIDGTEFDSSYKRGEPATFPAGRLIKGWVEALQLMKPGSTWLLAIPSDLAYGETGRPTIPPHSVLLFKVEMLGVKSDEEIQAEQDAALNKIKQPQQDYLDENAAKDGVSVTDSGLQYRVITEGTGKTPSETDTVVVHYAGRLIDGTEFDSSYKRGEPATFGVHQVIPGWTEALQLMKEGDKWEIALPYEIAYGQRGIPGTIPPFATLVFDVELIEVLDQE